MIDKEYGQYKVYCDVCNESSEDLDNFNDAIDWKKENNWKPIKCKNNEWIDLCPSCFKNLNKFSNKY